MAWVNRTVKLRSCRASRREVSLSRFRDKSRLGVKLTTPERQSGAATDRNGTTTLPEQEPGACRPACATAHRGTDWARRLSVCAKRMAATQTKPAQLLHLETATSVLALPYGQAPNPCHPAPSRARRRGTGCCNGSAPPSGRLRLGVSSPSTLTFTPRVSAADRPYRRPGPICGLPGRPPCPVGRGLRWSSLVGRLLG